MLDFRIKSLYSQVSPLSVSCHKSSWMPKETLQMDSVWHSWLWKKKLRSNLNATEFKVWFVSVHFGGAGISPFFFFCPCKEDEVIEYLSTQVLLIYFSNQAQEWQKHQ